MKRKRSDTRLIAVQAFVLIAFGTAYIMSGSPNRQIVHEQILKQSAPIVVPIEREYPNRISPLYDRPDWVSDEELASVLERIVPRFSREQMKPNFIEHALRTWSVEAEFQDPEAVSGQEMLLFLTDHNAYLESWGKSIRPLLEEKTSGVRIRWGADKCASYHHDHLLASLTEAGVSIDTPVYGPSRRGDTIRDVIHEALADFRLDEREVEWTAMAFGLWIPPVRTWQGGDGREYSFDLIAKRLMRGHKQYGVCSGTHRVYSLVVLLRIDEETEILSEQTRNDVWQFLTRTRDMLIGSQFEDGSWPSNWPDGAAAVLDPLDEPIYQKIISTGHHLEWQSIAPKELLLPDDQLQRAVDWIIATTLDMTDEQIAARYTFFTHVGSALANWKSVRPDEFWKDWELEHPYGAEASAIESP
ncbi:hypothetical protein AB1L42_10490 [Thalassoglobus sp. JC818]|uniref:hypothetical protein n=1 Tax=Thalassoglobus sp. JC818 TaxID=3232136 RepID=UPI00345A7D5C